MTPEGREALALEIEATEVPEEFNRSPEEYHNVATGLGLAAEIVRNHPAAWAWIPVAERLPEQGQHVLVWWRDSAATPDGLPWPTKFLRGDFHDPVYGAALGQVTHWMSLPAPPAPPSEEPRP